MRVKKRFEYLEHTADVYVAAYGSSLGEALENAALATVEVMTDAEKVEPKTLETVELEARDEASLLYAWLEELLIRFDAEGLLFSSFKVSSVEGTEGGFRLRAEIRGEAFDPARHPQRVGVKAVTYHLMEIVREPGGVTVKFVLDI
ncbi:hypothetical protein AC482_03555 [miscellaneous Crenarchaeota group-15 archaeon DG-45]|uniref:Protein archease n=1 Tax=miscellaneous Crenarchaeota group-15 archaeon DG-45 TaxID=1685127 RepID=A0A0M0BQ43_9ARCH|nr:MAG: hypothetical protein AC482_03555 [miscellaneous Crenarchaeota group-15 archaeon DG-45]